MSRRIALLAASQLVATAGCSAGTDSSLSSVTDLHSLNSVTSATSNSVTSATSSDSFLDSSLTPIQRATERILGYSRADISRAIFEATFAEAARCASEQGFPTTRADFPTMDLPPVVAPSFGSESVDFLLATLDPAPTSGVARSDTAAQTARNECMSKATSIIRSPLSDIETWLQNATRDLVTAVIADERYQAAIIADRQCIGKLGYEVFDMADLDNLFFDRTQEAMGDFQSGAINKEELLGLLRLVKAEMDGIAPEVTACLTTRMAVEYHVTGEYELEFLEQHGDALAEVVEKTRSQLTVLEPFLPR